eukprot:90344_1
MSSQRNSRRKSRNHNVRHQDDDERSRSRSRSRHRQTTSSDGSFNPQDWINAKPKATINPPKTILMCNDFSTSTWRIVQNGYRFTESSTGIVEVRLAGLGGIKWMKWQSSRVDPRSNCKTVHEINMLRYLNTERRKAYRSGMNNIIQMEGYSTPSISPMWSCLITPMSGVGLGEFVENESLTWDLKSNILKQIVDALVYLEHKKVIHADISDNNILVKEVAAGGVERRRRVEVKIIDFAEAIKTERLSSKTLRTLPSPEDQNDEDRRRAWTEYVLYFIRLCNVRTP